MALSSNPEKTLGMHIGRLSQMAKAHKDFPSMLQKFGLKFCEINTKHFMN